MRQIFSPLPQGHLLSHLGELGQLFLEVLYSLTLFFTAIGQWRLYAFLSSVEGILA